MRSWGCRRSGHADKDCSGLAQDGEDAAKQDAARAEAARPKARGGKAKQAGTTDKDWLKKRQASVQ